MGTQTEMEIDVLLGGAHGLSTYDNHELLKIGKRSTYEQALTKYLLSVTDEDRAAVLRFLRRFMPNNRVFTPTPEERFWPNVHITDGCWEWTGATTCGYGTFSIGGRLTRYQQPSHRVSYQWLRGPIPEEFDLDHLCRNRICVNPWHLEPITRSENVRRGWPFRYTIINKEIDLDNLAKASASPALKLWRQRGNIRST